MVKKIRRCASIPCLQKKSLCKKFSAYEIKNQIIVLGVCIDRALKSTAKEALLLIYKTRYKATNGEKELKCVIKKRKALFKENPYSTLVEKGKEETFDVSLLIRLITHVCGLDKEDPEKRKRFQKALKIIQKARNDFSHTVDTSVELAHVRKSWKEMQKSVVELLHLQKLDDEALNVIIQFKKIEKTEGRNRFGRKNNSKQKYTQARGNDNNNSKQIEKIVKEDLRDFYSEKFATLKPIPWHEQTLEYDLPVQELYTPVQVELQDTKQRTCSNDLTSIIGKGCLVMVGETGKGKSSTFQYYATNWATETLLLEYKYLFFIDLAKMKVTNRRRVQTFLFEHLKNLKKRSNLQRVFDVISKTKDILFLLDNFEPSSGSQEQIRILREEFSDATFVIATRPCYAHVAKKLLRDSAMVATIIGFTNTDAISYVKKLHRHFSKDEIISEELKNVMDDIYVNFRHLGDLISVPHLLYWIFLMWWTNRETAFSLGELFKKLTEFMIKKFTSETSSNISYNLNDKQLKLLSCISELAYEIEIEKRVLSTIKITKLHEKMRVIGYKNPESALGAITWCNSISTYEGTVNEYSFVDSRHSLFLSAYHVAQKDSLDVDCLKKLNSKRHLFMIFYVTIVFKDEHPKKEEKCEQLLEGYKLSCTFYDASFIMDLVEAAGTEEFLSIVRKVFYTLQSPTHDGVDSSIKFTFIRKNDIKRKQQLLGVLRFCFPPRLWLRLGDFEMQIRNGKEISMLSTPYDAPSDFLAILDEVYKDHNIKELIISEAILPSEFMLPSTLQNLSLIECSLGPFALPKGLQKFKLIDVCLCFPILITNGISDLYISNCIFSQTKVYIPNSVQYLTLSLRELQDDIFEFSENLRSLSITSPCEEMQNLNPICTFLRKLKPKLLKVEKIYLINIKPSLNEMDDLKLSFPGTRICLNSFPITSILIWNRFSRLQTPRWIFNLSIKGSLPSYVNHVDNS